MRAAQALYQGVEIGDETLGLISYMRTDSVRMSKSAADAARRIVRERFGRGYLPGRARAQRAVTGNAREAHEAIRPTDFVRTPDMLEDRIGGVEARLYDQIWKRAVASRMAAARLDRVRVALASGTGDIALAASGSVVDDRAGRRLGGGDPGTGVAYSWSSAETACIPCGTAAPLPQPETPIPIDTPVQSGPPCPASLAGIARFPRVRLGHAPTPIDPAPNLGAALGIDLWVKRDDCTGLAFGGNKVRQLEFHFGEARASGADTVLVTGAVQSNLVRIAAAAARRLGMGVHIQLEERVADGGETYRTSGNLLLDRVLGATLHPFPGGRGRGGGGRGNGRGARRRSRPRAAGPT